MLSLFFIYNDFYRKVISAYIFLLQDLKLSELMCRNLFPLPWLLLGNMNYRQDSAKCQAADSPLLYMDFHSCRTLRPFAPNLLFSALYMLQGKLSRSAFAVFPIF